MTLCSCIFHSAIGFAFVQFSSYFSATRALGAVNGREIGGRTVAVDWVVPKDKYQESLREQPVETGQTTERQGGTIIASMSSGPEDYIYLVHQG